VNTGWRAGVRDWPFSSFHRDVGRGIVADAWAGEVGEGKVRGQAWWVNHPSYLLRTISTTFLM
jgi:hypothetical protein